MTVKIIGSKAKYDELIASDKVVFIDFFADWCGPCKQISPVFESLAEGNTKEDVEFYKINIDDHSDVAQEAGIRSIPAFHVYKGGEKIGEFVGAHSGNLTALVATHTKAAA